MNLQLKKEAHVTIVSLLEKCIANEIEIEKILTQIEKQAPVLISDIPDYSFEGAQLLRDLSIFLNRLNRDKYEISRMEQECLFF